MIARALARAIFLVESRADEDQEFKTAEFSKP